MPWHPSNLFYDHKPHWKESPVPGQEVADTFVEIRPCIHGRRKQTAYNISGDCHSDVLENCLSPVLSDSCIALKTHSNPCQPRNTFHKKSASRGKTHSNNRINQFLFGRKVVYDSPFGFMHGDSHIAE